MTYSQFSYRKENGKRRENKKMGGKSPWNNKCRWLWCEGKRMKRKEKNFVLRKFGVHKHVFCHSLILLKNEGKNSWSSKTYCMYTPFSSLFADLEQCGKYGGKLDCFSLLLLFTA